MIRVGVKLIGRARSCRNGASLFGICPTCKKAIPKNIKGVRKCAKCATDKALKNFREGR